jgi:thiazole synthase
MTWELAEHALDSRLLLGTALYPSPHIMQEAITASNTQVVTVALRRQGAYASGHNEFWEMIKALPCHVLPNTAHCNSVHEAITTAQMAREVFATNWIKLEVIADEYTLKPDPFALLEAAKQLIDDGFEVFPYCTEDLTLCQRLVDAGCRILMPWASPIGSGRGVMNHYALQLLRARLPDVTLIIDAGIGKPSDAAQVMQMGYDGVLLNSAVALSDAPDKMASAFHHAIVAGRLAYEAGMMPERELASASTPLIGKVF